IEVEVSKYLTKTSTEVRSEEVSGQIQGMLAIIGDLERVGDIFFQMSKAMERKMDEKLWFSPEQRQHLLEMLALLEKAFNVMHRNLDADTEDRKSTRLNSSHVKISYAVFCLKKKKTR